ncbi:MAG: alpha/beta fold hydrolase [Pseudomonadota bacterium]
MNVSRHGLSFEDTETGTKALVFVHGIMMSKAVWHEQVAHFSSRYRVITLDLYGFGDSTGDFRDSSYEDHARDIRHLLDERGISDVTFIGWSLGGSVGLAYATAYPDALSRLILVDSTPKLIRSDDFPHAIDPEAASALLHLLNTDPAKGCAAFVDMQLPEASCDRQRALLNDIVQQADREVSLAHFHSSAQRDLRDHLPRVTSPTSILCGELDAVCPPGASAFMRNHIKNAELRVLHGLGHAPFLTDPAAFNLALSTFLDR